MGTAADLYNLAKFANRHPLAKQNKRRTLERFVRWQVASRTILQPIVLPFVGDTRLIISKQMPGAAVNYYFGLPEVEEVALALHFLREGELLGDIGANIGALTVATAGVARARVVAMEPVPSTYKALCDNVAINHLNDLVRTVQVGAGETADVLHFSTNSGGCDRIVTDGTGQPVPVRPLDEVFTETPNMLFLDVEGFEPAVVKGAMRLLNDPQLKVVIVETLGLSKDYGLDDHAMHQTMLRCGFQTARYEPQKRLLQPTDGMDSFNTIYVRDFQDVAERLRDAPSFRVDEHVF
jgi:FkbM family methyltransferase